MDAASLTRELVSIPSHENPARVGDRLVEWLETHTDADVERDDHGNVFARRGSGEQSLALVGHHDVVAPDDSQLDDDEYVLEADGDRLYGRGTADMKGSLAAMATAFSDADPAGELVFVSFVGEEQGGIGCRAAIDDGFAPDFAVVGEGSTGYSAAGVTDVAIAHKGRRGSTITARGAAAHASEPEAGENAIYRALDAVDIVRDLPFPETSVLNHEVAGSLVATEIEGGSAWNVVPEECTVTVDERTVPGTRAPLDRVERLDGVSWAVEQDLPPMACGNGRFADVALEAADTVQDGTPEFVVKPHATDAGWLASRAGTTCLVIGAAESGEAHTAAESVSLAVVDRCEAIYRSIAETWA